MSVSKRRSLQLTMVKPQGLAVLGALLMVACLVAQGSAAAEDVPGSGLDEEIPGVTAPTRPLLLIPGVGGSVLKARKRGSNTVNDASDVLIWVRMVSADTTFREYMWARFNDTSGEVQSLNPDWEVYAPDHDHGLPSVELLTPDMFVGSAYYFHHIIDKLKALGYEPGTTLFGFPYDWRQSVRSPTVLRALLKRITGMYELANKARKSTRTQPIRVDVMTHSMGCLVMKALFAYYPRETGKMIDKWICMAGPFHGSGKAVVAMIEGYNFGNPFVSKYSVRQMAMEDASVYELLPSPLFNWAQPPVVTLLRNNVYSSQSVKSPGFSDLLTKMNEGNHVEYHGEQVRMEFNPRLLAHAHQTMDVLSNVELPDSVRFYNLYGVGRPTPLNLTYDQQSIQNEKDLTKEEASVGTYDMVDGDETVPVESAREDGMHAVERVAVQDSHSGLLTNAETWSTLRRWLGMQCSWGGEWKSTTGHGKYQLWQQGRHVRSLVVRVPEEEYGTGDKDHVTLMTLQHVLDGWIDGNTLQGRVNTTRGVARFHMVIDDTCRHMTGRLYFEFATSPPFWELDAERVPGHACHQREIQRCKVKGGVGFKRCTYGHWSGASCEVTSCNPGYSFHSRHGHCVRCPAGTTKRQPGLHKCVREVQEPSLSDELWSSLGWGSSGGDEEGDGDGCVRGWSSGSIFAAGMLTSSLCFVLYAYWRRGALMPSAGQWLMSPELSGRSGTPLSRPVRGMSTDALQSPRRSVSQTRVGQMLGKVDKLDKVV